MKSAKNHDPATKSARIERTDAKSEPSSQSSMKSGTVSAKPSCTVYIAIHVDSFHVPAFWSAFSTSVKSTPPPVVESSSARPVPAPGAASQITVPVTASSAQLWSVTALSVSATSASARPAVALNASATAASARRLLAAAAPSASASASGGSQ